MESVLETAKTAAIANYRNLVARLVAGESVSPAEITASIVPPARGLAALEADVKLVQRRAELLNVVAEGNAAAVRAEEISVRTGEIRAEREAMGQKFKAADGALSDESHGLYCELVGQIHKTRVAGMRAASELTNTAEPGLDANAPGNFRLTN